jgi:hypothetical protein
MLEGALIDVWVGPYTGLNVWGCKTTDKCHEMKFLLTMFQRMAP